VDRLPATAVALCGARKGTIRVPGVLGGRDGSPVEFHSPKFGAGGLAVFWGFERGFGLPPTSFASRTVPYPYKSE
jgi:hypothetical protein